MPERKVELVVRRADYRRLLIDLVSDFFFNSYEIKANGPRVVAVNREGREYVVEQFNSQHEANNVAAKRREEVATLDWESWSVEHKIPADFLT
jgi:hypothetical protein